MSKTGGSLIDHFKHEHVHATTDKDVNAPVFEYSLKLLNQILYALK